MKIEWEQELGLTNLVRAQRRIADGNWLQIVVPSRKAFPCQPPFM